MSKEEILSELFATSIYRVNERKPLINLRPQAWVVQVTPQEAREWAFNILRCAEAATVDGFLVEFLMEMTGANQNAAASILQDFRLWREKASL